VRLELGFGDAECGRESEEELARRSRHLMEAGLPVDDLRERDEEAALAAARHHGRGALRVALDEVVVVLDPAHEILARRRPYLSALASVASMGCARTRSFSSATNASGETALRGRSKA
jgi:hypothetical protein